MLARYQTLFPDPEHTLPVALSAFAETLSHQHPVRSFAQRYRSSHGSPQKLLLKPLFPEQISHFPVWELFLYTVHALTHISSLWLYPDGRTSSLPESFGITLGHFRKISALLTMNCLLPPFQGSESPRKKRRFLFCFPNYSANSMYCIIVKLNYIYTLPNSLGKRDGYKIHTEYVSVFQQVRWLLEPHGYK